VLFELDSKTPIVIIKASGEAFIRMEPYQFSNPAILFQPFARPNTLWPHSSYAELCCEFRQQFAQVKYTMNDLPDVEFVLYSRLVP
jgi:ADP-heptose:LPS heptosyltransferase